MNIIKSILRLFIKPKREVIIGEFRRNDLCYCGSGMKFKKCHEKLLAKKKQTAFRVVNLDSNQESVKILENKSGRVKSNLRWVDIGVGGLEKVDP